MILHPSTSVAHRGHQRGSATFIVFVLAGCMAIFVLANTINLRRLDRELKLVEKHQMRKYPAATNSPPVPRRP